MKTGDKVEKTSGDYTFRGVVVSVFLKRDGKSERIVVENDEGIVHIFNAKQLSAIEDESPIVWKESESGERVVGYTQDGTERIEIQYDSVRNEWDSIFWRLGDREPYGHFHYHTKEDAMQDAAI